MPLIKIEQRIGEEIAKMRKTIEKETNIGKGAKAYLLSKCDKLNLYSRKAGAQLQRGQYRHAAYDARTQEDIAAQVEAKQAVFNALKAGRRVDLTMAAAFRVSQMHTAIAQIRKEIYKKSLPYILCDEWFRPEGGRPYKQYWLIKKEEDRIC